MVTLKLKVAPAVFACLFDELKQKRNRLKIIKRTIFGAEFGSRFLKEESVNFVRVMPGERKFDGEEMEMTLELTQEVPDADEHQGVKPNQKVTREMVGKLFDLLGLFPRKPDETVVQDFSAVQATIRDIRVQAARTDTSCVVSPAEMRISITRSAVQAIHDLCGRLEEQIGLKKSETA